VHDESGNISGIGGFGATARVSNLRVAEAREVLDVRRALGALIKYDRLTACRT